MLDPATLATLAASTIAALVPLLGKALEKGAEEMGKSAVATLFDKLKQRLKPAATREAMDDLAKQPADADTQAAARIQLKKALEADADLAEFLQELLAQSKAAGATFAITQTATTTGDLNTTIQVAGSGNTVR